MSASPVPSAGEDELQDIPSLPELLVSSSSKSLPLSSFRQPDVSAYLGQLTTLSLSTLQSEPTSLSSSSAQLTNALTTLCHTSYPTFLSLHATTSTLSSSLSSLSSSLDSLLSTLPALETSSRTFAQETRKIQRERRKASLIIEHHDKLYDILSLPMLLDSCIRNQNYNEALMLASHSTSLSQRFPDNPLIQSVRAECDARVRAMLTQLLGTLSEQAKLPALFRAVNFLRKMEVLEEQELALAFLAGRGVYLDGALNAVETEKKGHIEGNKERDKEAHAKYLKRYIDVWREGVQDVVTQYNTIFLERTPSTSSPATMIQLHTMLSTFATSRIQSLLVLLRETLPVIPDPTHLTPLLTQLTYCSNSFSRLGMDFGGLIAPIFIDAVRTGVILELDAATESWCTQLRPTQNFNTPLKKPSQLLITSSALASPPKPTPAQLNAVSSSPVSVPPQILASYPHHAIYLNAILSTLNGLRMLAPVELLADILVKLDGVLAMGGVALLEYGREKPWRSDQRLPVPEEKVDKESEVVRVAAELYFSVLVPFLRRALVEGVYSMTLDAVNHSKSAELEAAMIEWKESLATQVDS